MGYLNTTQVKYYAEELHSKQKTKSGKKYFGHCVQVAHKASELFLKESEDFELQADPRYFYFIRQAGYLHDAIEDCEGVTAETLLVAGVHPEVVKAVQSLTKIKGLLYIVYILGIKQNCIARFVKLADLDHNSKLSRLAYTNDYGGLIECLDRHKKYMLAYIVLKNHDSEAAEEMLREHLSGKTESGLGPLCG